MESTQARPYQDEAWLREKFVDERRGVREIGRLCDTHHTTIADWIDRHGIEREPPKYKQPEWLREKYVDEGLSTREMAERAECSKDGIRYQLDKHGIERPTPKWHDEDWLREQYVDERRSAADIAAECGVSKNGILYRLAKYGIERRESFEGTRVDYVTLYTRPDGYEVSAASEGSVKLHRLVAVAEHGFEAVCGNVVHHETNVPWDNRPGKLAVMSQRDHRALHAARSGPRYPVPDEMQR